MQGLKYILQISGAVLLVVFLLVFALRGCGLSRSYAPYDHPLTAEPKPWVFLEGSQSHDSLPWGRSNVPLWTVTPGDLAELAAKAQAHSEKFEGSMSLWLPTNAPGFSDELIALIEELGLGQRMVFLSPHDGLVKDLRKGLPESLFSLGMADSTQFYLLHTFFLESLAQFKADILIVAPEFLNSRREIPARVFSEIQRRNKSAILDFRQGGDGLAFWETPADGYMLPATHQQLEILNSLRSKEGGQGAR